MSVTDYKSLGGEELLKHLQQESVVEGITDLHFSPEKDFVRVEWRLHGILQKIAEISDSTYVTINRRVKFLAKLKLNVTNVPQDGQYTFATDEGGSARNINVRVATLPTRFGEKITLRLLDPQRGIRPLSELGFSKKMEKDLQDTMKLPHGLFLVAGPTGCGKTTTLYALLSTIVGGDRNIVTLENPVEYEINGIVQSAIDPSHDYTFSSGLRAVLRHDPDVILIGEIRDKETAQTAIDAALTGHLVLSTLHTNSASEAIPRLLSMGVSSHTFAPALRGILAQRLVRTLSDACKKKDAHCDPAANETYAGQTAIAEYFRITPEVKKLILQNASEEEVAKELQKHGFQTMREYGEELVKKNVTTIEEIRRVTQ